MKLLFSMMISSNILFLSYKVVDLQFGDRISARWKSNIAKTALLLALFPLGYIKSLLIFVLRLLGAVPKRAPFPFDGREMALITAPKGINATLPFKIEAIIFVIWFTMGISAFTFRLLRYIYQKKKVVQSLQEISAPVVLDITSRYKKSLGINRKITLLTSESPVSPLTLGIWRPLIILPEGLKPADMGLAIHHELCHMKYYDNLFVFIRLIVSSLYWFNPLFYFLELDIGRLSELACDEMVIKNIDSQQRWDYGYLIIEMAVAGNNKPIGKDLCAMQLCRDEENLKERITYIMNRKKIRLKGRLFTTMVAVCMIVFSAIPSFAYQTPRIVNMGEEDGTPTQIGMNETLEYFHNSSENPYTPSSIRYDYQFTGEDGSVFNLDDEPGASYKSCAHVYTAGETSKHIKKSGGCTIKTYNARRCSKCGYVDKGSLKGTASYQPCPH